MSGRDSRNDPDLGRTAQVQVVPEEGNRREPKASGSFAASSAPPRESQGWLASSELDRDTERRIAVKTSSEPVPSKATLTVMTGSATGQVFALDKPLTIGRSSTIEVSIADAGLSRKHAMVEPKDGEFILKDLGSTNGTYVRGKRLSEPVSLRSGDRFQLGPNIVLKFAVLDPVEEEMQRRLYESSTRDGLTTAYNRRYLHERLVAEIAHARRHKARLAVLMIDLDYFKQTNDAHGHVVGDAVLRGVAERLQRLIRLEDVLGRYGGEEFVILARGTDRADAARLGERVRAAIEALETKSKDTVVKVTASVGVASLVEVPDDGTPEDLVRVADERLYRAKNLGRNRVCSDDGEPTTPA